MAEDEIGSETAAEQGAFWTGTASANIATRKPGAWCRCTLGGIELPGVVTVSAAMPERKIDVKGGKGKGGATTTAQGWTPTKVSIKCVLWTPEHLATWRKIEEQMAPERDASATPRDIESPVLGTRVTSVMISRIGGLEQGSEYGTRVGVIEAQQWVAKTKNTGSKTPKTSTNSSGEGAEDLRDKAEWQNHYDTWKSMWTTIPSYNQTWEQYAQDMGVDPNKYPTGPKPTKAKKK